MPRFLQIIQAREGNEYAKDRLISMFLKIVLRMALWYHDKYSLPLKETIQDGNLGLITALEKMPLTDGLRFSTYAPWWIRQVITRSASIEFCDCFYVPVHKKDKLFRLVEIIKEHSCVDCADDCLCPNLKDKIIQQLNIDNETISSYLNLINEPISIEEYVGELSRGEVFSDNGKLLEEIDIKLSEQFRSETINQLFTNLHPREVDVMKRRCGFGLDSPMTLEQISDEYGVTRERIRQIEKSAKVKLKKAYDASFFKIKAEEMLF